MAIDTMQESQPVQFDGSILEHPQRQAWIEEHAQVFRRSVVENPNLPELTVVLYRSPHSNAYDTEGFEKLLPASDIVSIENFAWNKNTRDVLQAVTDGQINPRGLFGQEDMIGTANEFFHAMLTTLYQSNKPIVFLDQHMSHPVSKKLKKLTEGPNSSMDLLDRAR